VLVCEAVWLPCHMIRQPHSPAISAALLTGVKVNTIPLRIAEYKIQRVCGYRRRLGAVSPHQVPFRPSNAQQCGRENHGYSAPYRPTLYECTPEKECDDVYLRCCYQAFPIQMEDADHYPATTPLVSEDTSTRPKTDGLDFALCPWITKLLTQQKR
jgi:hypothetical protein